MSQQVQIDYKHIACQCNCVCELAEGKLKELEMIIASVSESAKTIANKQTAEFEAELEREKTNLLSQINLVKQKAENDANTGVVTVDNHSSQYAQRNDTIQSANRLQEMVNILSSEKIVVYQELLTTILGTKLSENYNKMLGQGNGIVTIPQDIQDSIDSLQDSVLGQFAYIAYLNDNKLSGDKLIEKAKSMVDETYESRFEKEQEKVREELRSLKLDKNAIDRVTNSGEGTAKEKLVAMHESATSEIIGEKIRQKSIKIIMNSVSDRGFIIDKKNIKINREANEVVMVAIKASGERAEFKVFMDGKFIYDFHHGYEGQACQKDIEPFIKDLEDVYGMHITKSQEIWSNPDKLSTMKYQAVNTNKNKR